MQKGLLFLAFLHLGAPFMGLMACGQATPQDTEGALIGVTSFPQEEPTEESADATEVPKSTATHILTPSPTPRPTICLDLQNDNGTITPICSTRTDDTRHRFYELASRTLREPADQYDSDQTGESDSGVRRRPSLSYCSARERRLASPPSHTDRFGRQIFSFALAGTCTNAVVVQRERSHYSFTLTLLAASGEGNLQTKAYAHL